MSTATRDAAFTRAVDQYLGWIGDPVVSLNEALEADPAFVLGQTTFAALHSIGGVPGQAEPIQTALKAAKAAGPANAKEELHLKAAQNWADGAINDAARAWEAALAADPHDLLALHLAHDTHFYLGDAARLRDVPLSVLEAQAPGSKERGYVLGMASFGLEESQQYEEGERAGREAVEINPGDTWAVHAVAHVIEMTGRPKEGISWLRGLVAHWAPANGLAVHQWWHLCLYLIEAGRFDEVLEIYDANIRGGNSSVILDLVDAAALLWRLELHGVDVGDRWTKLAPVWGQFAEDHVLAFNDVHIAFTLDGAGDGTGLEALEASLGRYATTQAENARFTRESGLPLIAGLRAFRRGDYAKAASLIAPLRANLKQIGGSNAQRDLFTQTLVIAAFRAGLPELAQEVIAERLKVKVGSPRAFAPYLAA